MEAIRHAVPRIVPPELVLVPRILDALPCPRDADEALRDREFIAAGQAYSRRIKVYNAGRIAVRDKAIEEMSVNPKRRKTQLVKLALLTAALCASGIAPRASFAQIKNAADAGAAADKQVDAFVLGELHRQKIPGLSIAVMRDGKIIKAKGYGLANVELNVPASPETIYQSGSMGKQFTATAVMMLVEEGRLSLDDRIKKYFPDAPATWDNITVRNLLTHTSGIKNYTTKAMDYRKDYTEDDLVKMAESLPLDFPPGTDWNYSNTGYVLLGILIHKVTGEFYGDFLQQHIFKPLGMNTTRIISERDIVPNRAAGYDLVKGEWKNQEWVSPSLNTTADGSLYFTVLDLAKWDAALYTEKLLKRADLDQMWTIAKLNDGKPNKGNYGFGWEINNMNGHRLIEHGGAWQGFTTMICRYVDDKLTVVVLTNLDSSHSDPEVIAHGVAGLYEPALAPPPPAKAIPDTEPQVTELLKNVIAQIAAGKLDLSSFTPEQQKDWTPDFQKGAQDFFAGQGALEKLELLSHKDENGVRVYRYRAKFAYSPNPMTLTLRLAADGKIAGLGIGD
ncbi:MAG TPA: serine hydrolase domain-containing protein [Candidatus Acidoferrales bacterium]|nr:serine hydrolase domain-containing protein [Candidatus Acidoferrales bacterium]